MNSLILLCAVSAPAQCYQPPPPCYYQPPPIVYYNDCQPGYYQPQRTYTQPPRTSVVPSVKEATYRPADDDDYSTSYRISSGRSSTVRRETYKEPVERYTPQSYTPPAKTTTSSDEKLDAIIKRLDDIERRLRALEGRKDEKDL